MLDEVEVILVKCIKETAKTWKLNVSLFHMKEE